MIQTHRLCCSPAPGEEVRMGQHGELVANRGRHAEQAARAARTVSFALFHLRLERLVVAGAENRAERSDHDRVHLLPPDTVKTPARAAFDDAADDLRRLRDEEAL